MKINTLILVAVAVVFVLISTTPALFGQRNIVLEDMEDLSDLTWWNRGGFHAKDPKIWGDIDVTQTTDCSEGKRALRFKTPLGKGVIIAKDISGLNLNIDDFDLLKFDCKLEGGPVYLVIALEHPPFAKGRLIDWYTLDSATMPFDWTTIACDLRWPEEVKEFAPEDSKKLYIRVMPYELNQTGEKPYRIVTLDNFRLVKKLIDVKWDQTKAPYWYDKNGDLVSTYELTVSNLDQKPHTILGRMDKQGLKLAKAALSEEQFSLKPGETRTIKADLRLPKAKLKGLKPLYCERVIPYFSVQGIEDSEIGILSSSDPIPLSVTVPIPGKLSPPFVNEYTLHHSYDKRFVEKNANALFNGKWKPTNDKGEWGFLGMQDYGEMVQYLGSMYVKTKDKTYAEAAKKVIMTYADEHHRRKNILRDRVNWGVQTIHATRFNTTTLNAGWFMRPLLTGYDAVYNSGVFSETEKKHILDNFILPMAIIMRNHLIGLGNQQSEVNFVVNYAGLLANNYPLISFAYTSKEGLRNQIKYNFSEDGFASEGHYHYAVLRPLVDHAEVLANLGVNVYDKEMRRLFDSYCEKMPLPHTHRISLDVAYRRYGDRKYDMFHKDQYPDDIQAGHLPFYGYTILRQKWQGDLYAAAINWGHHEYRNAPDRMTVEYFADGRVQQGGREYNHSSLDQSTILVDMDDQDPRRGKVDFLQPKGDIQVVSVSTPDNAPLYPGVKIIRTLALIRGCLLTVDRAISDTPHTYDNVTFTGKPESCSLKMTPVKNRWGKKHGYESIVDAQETTASQRWSMTWGKGKTTHLTNLPVGPTNVLVGSKKKPRGKPILILRKEAKIADWVTFTERVDAGRNARMSGLKKLPVMINGKTTDQAIGLSFKLDDKVFTAIINYTSDNVTCNGVETNKRWTCVVKPK